MGSGFYQFFLLDLYIVYSLKTAKIVFFFFIRIKHMCTYEQLLQTLQTYIIVLPPARNYKVISPEVLDYVERKRNKIFFLKGAKIVR